jgi:hypothetical protein
MVIRCLGDDLARFVHDKFHGPPPSNAPVSAAAKARSLSNLVPAPAFQPMKIMASVFDMRNARGRLAAPQELTPTEGPQSQWERR